MQFSDSTAKEQAQIRTIRSLRADERGLRLIEFMREELARLDKQNRVIGQENKESAAFWLAEFLELVDSENTTDSESAA